MSLELSSTALLLIDIQNDFCAGGALAVPDANQVVEPANRLIEHFETAVLTQDWHPPGHHSFASSHAHARAFDQRQFPYGEQTLWPDHCVQGTAGANFHPDLNIDKAQLVLRKGFRPRIDSYSAFFENDRQTPTGLAGYLRDRNLRAVVICGLALDYCVAYSAIDARRVGLRCTVVTDACRAINLDGSEASAIEAMQQAGVQLADLHTVTTG